MRIKVRTQENANTSGSDTPAGGNERRRLNMSNALEELMLGFLSDQGIPSSNIPPFLEMFTDLVDGTRIEEVIAVAKEQDPHAPHMFLNEQEAYVDGLLICLDQSVSHIPREQLPINQRLCTPAFEPVLDRFVRDQSEQVQRLRLIHKVIVEAIEGGTSA